MRCYGLGSDSCENLTVSIFSELQCFSWTCNFTVQDCMMEEIACLCWSQIKRRRKTSWNATYELWQKSKLSQGCTKGSDDITHLCLRHHKCDTSKLAGKTWASHLFKTLRFSFCLKSVGPAIDPSLTFSDSAASNENFRVWSRIRWIRFPAKFSTKLLQ